MRNSRTNGTDVPATPEFTLSKGRFEAFSDGVFAIAITLLILEVRLPPLKTGTEAEQLRNLLGIWPSYLVYAASFATIGIMWINHHALFRYIERVTHAATIANLALLGLISFLPFLTQALGTYGLSPVTVVAYGMNFFAISIAYTVLLRCVTIAAGQKHSLRLWSMLGLLAYPLAALVGYFVPVAGVLAMVLLAVYYMLPANVASVAIRPAADVAAAEGSRSL
jgi:uncharacterized membrane protein